MKRLVLITSVALLWAAGCGSSGQGLPCESLNPPPECGMACATDDDCGPDLYCDDTGHCTAVCTPGGDQCGPGRMCGDHGRCVDVMSMPDAPDSCPGVDVRLDPVTPTVLILIDQSGSMTSSFGSINGMSVNRWEAVRVALTDPGIGALTALEDRVRFGAVLYYSNNGNAGGTCPILTPQAGVTPAVPELNNRAAIDALLAANQPQDDTPTAEAITQTAADLLSYQGDIDNPPPLVMVLATDGNPDNCVDPDAHNQMSQDMSEMAVQNAYADGIKTFALSVGANVSATHMQRLANAGVGKPLDEMNNPAPWWQANSPQGLVDAFNQIIRGTRTCTFDLDGTVDLSQADEGTVILNGRELMFGTDWILTDENTMELLGSACDEFLNTDNVDLTAQFPCGAVVL